MHQVRTGESLIDKTSIIDKRKRPLSEVVSVSQQNKRYASFGRDAHKKIKQLILQHRMVSESGEPIHLRNMELEYKDHIINIKYNLSLDHIKLDAYVRACDEALLGRDGYRRNSDGIVVDEQEIGNGVYRSIRSLLKLLIPIWNKSILQSGDTIILKLGGDGRNVGRKQNHVMITICLLNEKDEVLKPDHQYW